MHKNPNHPLCILLVFQGVFHIIKRPLGINPRGRKRCLLFCVGLCSAFLGKLVCIENVDSDVLIRGDCGSLHNGSDRLCDLTVSSDYLTHIYRGNVELKEDILTALLFDYNNAIGIGNDRLYQILKQVLKFYHADHVLSKLSGGLSPRFPDFIKNGGNLKRLRRFYRSENKAS